MTDRCRAHAWAPVDGTDDEVRCVACGDRSTWPLERDEAWLLFCRFLERIDERPCRYCRRPIPGLHIGGALVLARQMCIRDLVCQP